MKIIVITHAPANREVTDRLSGHTAISFVAQKSPDGMLELIKAHWENVSIIYFDPTALLFVASERLVWETTRKINELIGKRRNQVILILGLEDGISGLSGKSLSDRLTREQVNIGMVGKRDSSQIATFINSVATQFGPYVEKFGAVFEPPEPSRMLRRGQVRSNGHDHTAADAKKSDTPVLPRASCPAPTPVVAEAPRNDRPTEEAATTASPPQSTVSEITVPATVIAPKQAPSVTPTAKSATRSRQHDVAELVLDLDLIESALTAGLHAMFEVLRKGIPESGKGTNANEPEAARPSPSQTVGEAGNKFTVRVVGSVEKEHGDSTRERLVLNGKEVILVRRARRMLEALATHGSCSLNGIFPSATPQAVASFVWETNRKLAKAQLPIMIHASNKENRLHVD